MVSWRARSASSSPRQASSCASARATRPSSASVTPRQAESTTPRRPGGSVSRMLATRLKHSASATEEPPNLCTTQAEGSEDGIENLDLRGVQKKPGKSNGWTPSTRKRERPQTGIYFRTTCRLHRLLPLYDRARLPMSPWFSPRSSGPAAPPMPNPARRCSSPADGEYAGLLSGGCLEGDLREHAREVAATGTGTHRELRPAQHHGPAVRARRRLRRRHGRPAVARVGEPSGWQPLADMAESLSQLHATRHFAFVVASSRIAGDFRCGVLHFAADAAAVTRIGSARGVELFVAAVAPPPHLLLLGGGPDARPVATLAAFLGWRITVVDHRAAYLVPGSLSAIDETGRSARRRRRRGRARSRTIRAAIVMSHHLESDLHYLRALAASSRALRRACWDPRRGGKSCWAISAPTPRSCAPRLRAPVGLDIGGRTPESIALSIIGEVHAALAGRAGRPFSETSQSSHASPMERTCTNCCRSSPSSRVSGVIAGFAAGLLGVGGGIVTVPVLEFSLRFAGVPEEYRMHVAVATSLAAIIPDLDQLGAHASRARRRRLGAGEALGGADVRGCARRQPARIARAAGRCWPACSAAWRCSSRSRCCCRSITCAPATMCRAASAARRWPR